MNCSNFISFRAKDANVFTTAIKQGHRLLFSQHNSVLLSHEDGSKVTMMHHDNWDGDDDDDNSDPADDEHGSH